MFLLAHSAHRRNGYFFMARIYARFLGKTAIPFERHTAEAAGGYPAGPSSAMMSIEQSSEKTMDYGRLLILLVVLAGVFLVVQGPAWLRARKVRGTALEDLATVLPAGVDPAARILLYFWSPSCGMCRNTTPVINELQKERSDVVSVNAMEQLKLAQQAGIMGTPAFVVVSKGVVEQLIMGSRSRRQIESLLAAD